MKQIILSMVALFIMTSTTLADNDKPITVGQLPAAAKQFIAENFSGVTVSYAKMDTDWFDKSYEVVFSDGNKVEFDRKGKWTDVDCKFTQVPEEIVPQPIKKYVVVNYMNLKIVEIDRDSRDYEVRLSNGIDLKFDLKFNLIEINN